jgi:dipeptidase E
VLAQDVIYVGMNCWFEASVTDSFDLDRLAALHDGLGLLPGTACPHYDGDPARRPTFTRLVGAGELGDGWAADDGAGLVFAGRELVEVMTSRPEARAFRVSRGADGGVSEVAVPTRYLGS